MAYRVSIHDLVLLGEWGFTELALVDFFADDTLPVEILGQAVKLLLHIDVSDNAITLARAWLWVLSLSS